MVSRAFARRTDGLLSSGFQVRAQRVSIARSGQRARAWAFLPEIVFGCLVLEQGVPLNFHALQELTFSAGDNWFILPPCCRTCRAPSETVKNASSVIQP